MLKSLSEKEIQVVINSWSSFDTETVNRAGRGEACLLLKSGKKFREFPETFDDVFDFLKGGKYTCFNMDFDARSSVHEMFLPWRVLETLGMYGRATWGAYSFEYLPKKFLKVRRKREHFELYDIQQFFDCSLARAAKKHLKRRRKKSIPKSWYLEIDRCLKDGRRARILDYGHADVKVTDDLRNKLIRSFGSLGIKCDKLVSAGSLAMRKFGPALSKEPRLPGWVNSKFSRGFYGGRIEVSQLGLIRGPVRLFDKHSAYPAYLAQLKTLRGCRFRRSGQEWEYDSSARYGVYRVIAKVPLDWHWGPLAVRMGGVVSYPVGIVKTWCCLPALKVLRKMRIPFKVEFAAEYCGGKNERIFTEINRLYKARKNPVSSLAIKKCLASIYGKTCESKDAYIADEILGAQNGNYRVRRLNRWGRYNNYAFAAHVTESVRMEIFEILHRHGRRAFGAATDSVLLRERIPTGPRLGQWDLKGRYSSVVVLGCGRYILRGGGKSEIHMRGVPPTRETVKKLRNCKRAFARVEMLSANSLKTYSRLSCLADLNVLTPIFREIRVADEKRKWSGKFRAIRDCWKSHLKSEPWVQA